MVKYAIACRTPWFWDERAARGAASSDEVLEIRTPEELTLDALQQFAPRYVFFPHWSVIVPPEITEAFECVCFHATAVPYGRGGSPIQNLIVRGHDDTVVTALRMTSELDAGPVYLQRPVSLLGGLEEILIRIGSLVVEMIDEIVRTTPEPRPQSGEPVVFKRRKPEESAIPADASLDTWFDYIRMLDAEGYPRAFIDAGDMRLEFSRAARRRGAIEATVTIRPRR